MRPRRIQIPWVKTALSMLLLAGPFNLLPAQLFAQQTTSSCGGTIQSATHSFTITGLSPNTTNTFTLPQYDFTVNNYQLISAVMTSSVTTNNSVTFTNSSTNPDPTQQEQDFFPVINRSDVLKMTSPASTTLGAASVNYNFPFTELDHTGDDFTYGPGNFFNNTQVVYDSVNTSSPTLNNFLGSGNLTFTYKNTNFLNSVPSPGVTPSVTETDDITISVTYYFCNPTVLSSNIITFTATRQDDHTVALNWITANEQPGRRYDIQVSTDGLNYSIADSRPSDPVNSESTYFYNYPIPYGATGKLYFRLQQVESNGTANYSSVRVVDLAGNGPSGFFLYPNPPSDYINLNFPAVHDWKVDIIAADGGLVQRVYYPHSSLARVNFNRRLSAGTYFARATDAEESRVYVASFTIH